MISSDHVYHPDFDLGDFRYAVARFIKLLIRARWKVEPGFSSDHHLAAWGLQDISADPWPPWMLLDQAAAALAVLNTQFLPRCGSGGVRETDQSTPEGRLIGNVAGLVQLGDSGGPCHNDALLEAARRLRDGKDVDWRSLVAWETLAAIRADLDQLPHPRPKQRSDARSEQPAHQPCPPFSTLGRQDDAEAGGLRAVLAEIQEAQREVRDLLVSQRTIKDFYSVEEFAVLVAKSEYTCREWCRNGRIRATKKGSGRGKHQSWAISHDELLRYQKEGLLPLPRPSTK